MTHFAFHGFVVDWRGLLGYLCSRMIKKLDWYIFKKFISTYLFVVLGLVLVLCVIDFTEKNDDFIKYGPTFKQILLDYYLNFIPYWANLLSPITIFIATVFVTSRLAARTEIVAILSSGISFIRLLVPFAAGAMIVGGVILYLVNFVIPKANKVRIAFELKYTKPPFRFEKRNIHFRLSPDVYAYMESYNNESNQGYLFTLEHVKGNSLVEKLKAESINWLNDSIRPKWRLSGITVRKFDPSGACTIKKISTLDTALNLYPKDFGSTFMLYETFTTPELNQYIDEMTIRGSENMVPFQIEKILRFTFPFAILILTLIGVILSAKKSREGPGFQIAIGFVLAFIYILLFMVSRSVATAGDINPLLACWLPNIIFTIVGFGLYKTVPK